MARKKRVEVQCDRCERVEYVDESQADNKKLHVTLSSELMGKPIREICYEDLCKVCMRTVLNHLDAISKEIKGKSPDRAKSEGKKEGAGDPPAPARRATVKS